MPYRTGEFYARFSSDYVVRPRSGRMRVRIKCAIDFHEGDKIDEEALKALIRAAVALNTFSAAQPRRQWNARSR